MIDINKSLHYSDDRNIESTYIISLENNKISQDFTKRCIESCVKIGQDYKIWNAFDGTSGKIITPEHLKNKDYLGWLKLYNVSLTPTQVACFFSHFSLWCHCIEIDRPIVILEHDAIMVDRYLFHNTYGIIVYLGSQEQYTGRSPLFNIPPHATDHCGHVKSICRAHAYALDPVAAKNLVSHVIREGIYQSLDIYMRADFFPIVQFGLFAYDNPFLYSKNKHESTIHKDWKNEKHWR